MNERLRLQAARLVLETLDADEIKSTIEALVDRGMYLDLFLPALVETHPRFDDVLPAFRAALAEHAIPIPDARAALFELVRHHLRLLVAGGGEPREQLGRLVDEVCWHDDLLTASAGCLGEAYRIERLLGLYGSVDDLRACQVPLVNGHQGAQAWAELDRLIVAEAERWLANDDGDS